MLLTLLIVLAVTLLILYRRRRFHHVEISKQTVVITGGSHGIGWALAELLIGAGATVIIVDLNPPPSTGENLTFHRCDVGDEHAVAQLTEKIRDLNPTVLVNNAGIHNSGKRIDQLSAAEVRRIVNTNLLGVIWMTKAFLPSMIRQGHGHIINVASCLGLGGLNNMADYCATKFGVVGFTESLRLELKVNGHWNVKTTVVCPFLVDTGMFQGLNIAHPWITPPLLPLDVAKAIFDAIKYRNKEIIRLPSFLNLYPLLRVFPCWFYDRIQMMLGSCESFIFKE